VASQDVEAAKAAFLAADRNHSGAVDKDDFVGGNLGTASDFAELTRDGNPLRMSTYIDWKTKQSDT
jgi:hypothetical protein